MQVFITGATGLIGQRIVRKLLEKSHSVTILTRDMDKARRKFGNQINYCHSLCQFRTLDHFDAVINLAGEPLASKRWTEKQKKQLCLSRWRTTLHLAELIRRSELPPKVFISGSAIGYYGAQRDNPLNEQSKAVADFTHRLAERWEKHALEVNGAKTRVCVIRTGIVLSPDGGALAKMLPPFRLGLGGVVGSGRQYMSWIHIEDIVEAIYFLLNADDASGPFNLCAPNAVTNHEFSHTLANVLNRPCFMPIPAFGLALALGEMSTVIVDGQRAVPEKLQQAGFRFRYDSIEPALKSLLKS